MRTMACSIQDHNAVLLLQLGMKNDFLCPKETRHLTVDINNHQRNYLIPSLAVTRSDGSAPTNLTDLATVGRETWKTGWGHEGVHRARVESKLTDAMS